MQLIIRDLIYRSPLKYIHTLLWRILYGISQQNIYVAMFLYCKEKLFCMKHLNLKALAIKKCPKVYKEKSYNIV